MTQRLLASFYPSSSSGLIILLVRLFSLLILVIFLFAEYARPMLQAKLQAPVSFKIISSKDR